MSDSPIPEDAQKVLLIDDDEAHLKSIGDIFEEEGLTPVPCCDGASALKACREHDIHVAVMDLKLPDGDGIVLMFVLLPPLEVCRRYVWR